MIMIPKAALEADEDEKAYSLVKRFRLKERELPVVPHPLSVTPKEMYDAMMKFYIVRYAHAGHTIPAQAKLLGCSERTLRNKVNEFFGEKKCESLKDTDRHESISKELSES